MSRVTQAIRRLGRACCAQGPLGMTVPSASVTVYRCSTCGEECAGEGAVGARSRQSPPRDAEPTICADCCAAEYAW